MINSRIRINVPIMVFSDQLGEDFDLPNTPELHEAILTINKACAAEVRKRDKIELEQFIGDKFNELKSIAQKNSNSDVKIALMMEIINYKRLNPLKL